MKYYMKRLLIICLLLLTIAVVIKIRNRNSTANNVCTDYPSYGLAKVVKIDSHQSTCEVVLMRITNKKRGTSHMNQSVTVNYSEADIPEDFQEGVTVEMELCYWPSSFEKELPVRTIRILE